LFKHVRVNRFQNTTINNLGWEAGGDLTFNAAFISATQDQEIAFITPVLVPRVGNDPVRCAGLSPPAKNFDGMTTQHLSRLVLVYSGFVGEEISVDGEGSLDWTMGHNLSLDLADIRVNRIGRSAEAFGRAPVGCVVHTLAEARRSWLRLSTRLVGAVHVVIAVGQRIRQATTTSIVASVNHSRRYPVVPGSAWETTIATEATRITARVHVLGGDVRCILSSRCDTDPISHGFNSAKSPARSTSSLVADLRSRGADAPPLLASVERVWDCLDSNFLDW